MSRLNFGVWVLVIVVGLSNGFEDEKCGEIADIAFVLDSSRSINGLNFTTEKEFVGHIIDMFDVKPDKTQVAALQFGSDVKVEFNFNEVKNAEEAHQKVSGIKQSNGKETFTHLALEAARTQLFSSNNGARANVRKVIILLSDGASTQAEMTKEEARRVKAAGITIMAVGIGEDIKQINRKELEEVVTAPASENFFYAITFEELKTKHFQNLVGKQACDDQKDKEDTKKCGKIADIAFVLDSSSSIYFRNFTTEKEFVGLLIDRFDVKPDKTQVAALQFAYDVKVEFNFNEVKNAKEAHQKVSGIKQSNRPTTNTHLALEAARTQLFSSNNGARANVRKVIILLSDGESTQAEMTKEEARRVKAAGITIMAVGIGHDIKQINRKELAEVVTAPASENFFYAITFDELKTKHFQNLVGKQACDDQKDKEDTTCQGKEADVVFVLDQSNTIWNPFFKQQLQFVNDTVDMFDISSGKTQVGAAVFSDGAEVVFDLNRYNNKEDIGKAVMGIQQRGGLTNTHLAINVRGYSFTVVGDYRTGARIINGLTTKVVLVLDQMFTKKGGYRPSVAHICIIITDGDSRQPRLTADLAQKARDQGVIMIAIGVGNMTNSQELNDIASGKDYVFEVNGYEALPRIKKTLAYETCTATKPIQGKAAVKPLDYLAYRRGTLF